jgi:2-polyprenyl-3-methyl-5-hydroxy-6-metoxy-1,4-benzoquinol methylase
MSSTQRESAEAAVSLWTAKPVGGQRSKAAPGTDKFFQDVEAYRYGYETPWIPRIFGFEKLRGKNVLELGVGLGIDGSNIASHGAKYTGVDITQRHLDLAEQNFARKGLSGRFIHGDLTAIDLPEKSFDVIYSFGVLHHIEAEEDVLKAVHRSLKDDGAFMFAVYSKYSYFNAFMFAKWIWSGAARHYRFSAYQAHVAEAASLDFPVTIKVRSKAEVMRLYSKYFLIAAYCKRGFVSRYLPFIGKYLQPDGMVLNACGSMLGWYHVMIAKKG